MVSSMLRGAGFERITFERYDCDICIGRDMADAIEFAMQPGRAEAVACADRSKEPLDMATKSFTSGRLRKAEYDPASRQLDLHWDNRSVLAYKHVPEEVYRRLCSAPNPATYWEDRIADEYPKGTPMTSGAGPDSARKLSDLFGDGD